MEEFEYSKTGEVYKCLNLDAINNSPLIPDRIKEECQEKFNKHCFFKQSESTKVGKLTGIEINTKFHELFYILEDTHFKIRYYIPCKDTILKRL